MIKDLLKKTRGIVFFNFVIRSIIKYTFLKKYSRIWPVSGRIYLKAAGKELLFYSKCDDYLLSEYFYENRLQEEVEIEFLKQHINNQSVFFDIGSYNGIYSIILKALFPDLKVFIFEPHPGNYSRIKRNLELNKLSDCKMFDYALSSSSGVSDFYIPDDGSITTVSSFNKNFSQNLSRTSFKRIKINTATVDDVVRKYVVIPNVIKIDVEGHELETLRGAEKTMSLHKPLILCEVFTKKFNDAESFRKELPNVFELNALIRKYNYRIYSIQENLDLIEYEDLNIDSSSRNFVFK